MNMISSWCLAGLFALGGVARAETPPPVDPILPSDFLGWTNAYRLQNDRAEAVLTLDDELAAINLIVYPRFEERIVFKTRDGRVRQRVRLDALRKLLDETTNDTVRGIEPDTALSP